GADGPLVDLLGGHLVGHQAAHSVHDLGPTAVVEGDGERHALVLLGHGEGLVHTPDDAAWQPPVAAADEADAHTAVVELLPPADEDVLVEVDKESHLVGRAPPVLGGEGVHGEPFHAQLEGALDRFEESVLTLFVALGAGQTPSLGPSPVAVHDAPDVGGDAIGIDPLHADPSAARAASTSLFICVTSASVDSKRSSPRSRVTNRTR